MYQPSIRIRQTHAGHPSDGQCQQQYARSPLRELLLQSVGSSYSRVSNPNPTIRTSSVRRWFPHGWLRCTCEQIHPFAKPASLSLQEKGTHLYQLCPSANYYSCKSMAIGARSQSARTYLEKNLDKFATSSQDELIKHCMRALRDTLPNEVELTVKVSNHVCRYRRLGSLLLELRCGCGRSGHPVCDLG